MPPYSPPAEPVPPLLPGPSTTEDNDAQAPSVPAPPPLAPAVSGRRPVGDPAAWIGDAADTTFPSPPLVVVAPPPLSSLTDEAAEADVPVVVLLLPPPPPVVPGAVILLSLLYYVGVRVSDMLL